MNKKSLFKTTLVILITIFFVVYIRKNIHLIKQALQIKPVFLISILLLNVLNKVVLGFKTKKLVEVFSVKLSFFEWFGTSIINNFYNYLAPKSGTALVGVYFKNKHDLNYHKYLSLLITSGMITILASGILGLFACVSVFSHLQRQAFVIVLVFVLMILAPLLALWIPRVRFPHQKIMEKANKFLEGWNVLRKNRKLLCVLFVMDVAVVLLMALRYYIMFRMFSVPMSFLNCVIISPFNIIVHVATIVPGAYGIKEAVVGLVSQLTGGAFSSGMLATLSDRVVVMALTFVLGPIFSLVLIKKGFDMEGAKSHE